MNNNYRQLQCKTFATLTIGSILKSEKKNISLNLNLITANIIVLVGKVELF